MLQKNILKQSPWLIISFFAIAFITAVFLVGKKLGKGNNPNPRKLPNNGSGIPDGWSAESIARQILDAFDGLFTSTSKKLFVLGNMQTLTDDQLTAVYNRFNEAYGGGDSLYEWIAEEWSLTGHAEQEVLLDRMRKLELT